MNSYCTLYRKNVNKTQMQCCCVGLFSKAIAQSGTPLNSWALYPNPKKQSQRFAAKFGCPVENSKEMIVCLKKIDAIEFVEAHREMTVIVIILSLTE